jgi:predicted peroxiredoxin
MKKLFFVFIVLSIALFNGCKADVEVDHEKSNDGVFVHISHGSDDAHRLLMGLQMAVKMAEDKDVLVYFDIKGIEAVLKDADNFEYSVFPDSKTQLNELIAKGVDVMACPGCLKAAGKTENDLMDGVTIADKNKFFSFTEGRIITLDY